MDLIAPVHGLNVGRAGVLLRGGREFVTPSPSKPVTHPLRFGHLGLDGDKHVHEFHAGRAKALLAYSYHYHFWPAAVARARA